VTAPTDSQAWRLTKEIFRPNLTDSQHHALGKLIEASEGSDQVGEIDLANGSKWTAKGAWATGKAIRGPHRYYGIADEMQDMTRTAWYVLLEVVNLPGRQIIAMGTGGSLGTIWHELWEKSDKKEWDGKKWTPTKKNATPGYSGYHLSQAWSPFETPDYVMCDAGYSKKMPQELMAMFPKKVWAVTIGDRKESFPSWTVKNKDSDSRQLLPKEQWEYFCDTDHAAMCEILETHVTNKTFHIIDIDQCQSIDEYLLELNMADIVEVESRETVKRRYSITKAHSYAATCYALLPFTRQRKKQTMFPAGR
jgi:hypothetical protein